MAPYLESITSFADVPITDAGIDTLAFLQASTGLVGLFDLLGSAAFVPVTKDLTGNIAKVRARYDATPTLSSTLQKLVENEKGEKKQTATEGLMWLLRGLFFTLKALQYTVAHPTEELNKAFAESYSKTLSQFHNFVVKGVFSVALKACPYRKDFFEKLRADPNGASAASEETVQAELTKWLSGLEKIVTTMQTFYEQGKYGKVI
ncbi:het-c2 protein [Peniophora sp. CONT]|nr:het-c2 protein [Peniophora sp. CONT]